MPQKGSSLRLIVHTSLSASCSSWVRTVLSRSARANPAGEDAHAEDRGVRGPEDVVPEEQELRRIRDFFAARLRQLPLALVPPRLVVFDEPVDHIVLEQLQVLVFSQRRLRVRQD